MMYQNATTPHLIVLTPDSIRRLRIDLAKECILVGRDPTCDVRLNDPRVSRTHAVLRRRGTAVFVQDLNSTCGTFVNGVEAGTRELRSGDIVAFAAVQARFEAAPSHVSDTEPMSVRAAASPDKVGNQPDDTLGDIGRDPYSTHVQNVMQQRYSFLRENAAARTRARRLVWTGCLMFAAGIGLFAAVDLSFIRQLSSDMRGDNASPPAGPFGHDIAGVPSGLVGCAVAALGVLLMAIGIAAHMVAASRRRRADRDLPLLPR